MGPFTGISLVARAATEILKRPRLVLMGMVPPLLVTLGYIIAAFLGGPTVVAGVTGWVTDVTATLPEWLGQVIAAALLFAIATGITIVAGYGFTALTLMVGGPVYDKISTTIDTEVLGITPDEGDKLAVSVARSGAQSAVVLGMSLIVALLAVSVNIVPAVGQFLSVATGLGLGGSLLTTELLSGPFSRRGLPTLRQRWAIMRNQPIPTLSFAIPAQLVLTIPLISVAAFPFFSAAATMLADKLINEAPPEVVDKDRTYDF